MQHNGGGEKFPAPTCTCAQEGIVIKWLATKKWHRT